MDENIKQNSPQEPAPKPASPTQGGPASYTRPRNSSPNFFDKFFSFFTKKTIAVLVILILVIGVGAATIAVQRSTEFRQRAATTLIPGCGSLGDVNGDGKINSIDSNLILQYSAGLIPISGIIAANADVNGDGKINSIDSNLILQYTAGLISTFPGCSTGSVISGTVFVDSNGNAVQDSGETDYPGSATIKLETGVTATKFGNGYYFTGVASGSHSVTLTVPSSYTKTTPTSVSVSVPPSPGTFKFGIKSGTVTPGPTVPPGVTASPTPQLTKTPTPTVPPSSAPPCNIPVSIGVGTGGYGDVNRDGQVTSVDSSLILQFSGGLITFTPAQIEAADVNGAPNVLSSAANVNSIDSSLILQYVAGLISTFPVCSSSGSVISGTVFVDSNGNRVQDSGETDYPGTATIKLETGVTATKFGNGYYFTGVASGSHTVTLTVPSGYTATTPIPESSSPTSSLVVIVPPSPGTFKFGIKSGTVTPGPTVPPGVTASPTPQPTIPVGNTVFAATIGLDAIGTTGDNNTPNDSSGSNKNPARPSRNIKVEVFDGSGNPVANKSGTLAYQTGSGKFTGNIDMENLASGNYNVKVKSDGYLRRLIPGIQNVTAGQTYNVPAVNLVTGDINGDNAINILDYNILISCSIFSTDNQGLCNSNSQYTTLSDLDDNGAVNQLDYNLFLRELSVQNGD